LASSVQAEMPDDALNLIPAFTDGTQRDTARAIVAVAFANTGRPAKAVELADLIDDSKSRAIAWRSIGIAQAKAGLTVQSVASFDRAVQAAMSLKIHDRLLSEIAIAQADVGQIDEALRVTALIGGTMETAGYVSTVNGVNSNYDRRVALRAIAKAQARAGRLAEAIENAHALVQDGNIISPGLGVVAEALAEAGRIDEAIEAAAVETNASWRAELLAQIANARAAVGQIADAKKVVQHITEDRYRADALASIAAAQSKASLKVDATATFAESLQIAQSLRYKNIAAESLMAIAARLPE
jgi:tetratricopeptide (TPR) repeat protein